jgi:hypothetical protein
MERNASPDERPIQISRGGVFIQSGTSVPPSLDVAFHRYGCWKTLAGVDSDAVESVALASGWHFSFMPPAVDGRAVGLTRSATVHHALEKVMQCVRNRQCNALEIADVRTRHVLGLNYVTLVAYCRHLGPGPFLCQLDPRYYPEDFQEFEQIFRRAARIEPEIKGI